MESKTVSIFIAYSRGDEKFREELEIHLQPLKRSNLISYWHDRKMQAGAEWEQEIDKYLHTANIILLLISPDFIASDYCYSNEMKKALDRHQTGEAKVIPIILRPTGWEETPLSKLQALPKLDFIQNQKIAFVALARI